MMGRLFYHFCNGFVDGAVVYGFENNVRFARKCSGGRRLDPVVILSRRSVLTAAAYGCIEDCIADVNGVCHDDWLVTRANQCKDGENRSASDLNREKIIWGNLNEGAIWEKKEKESKRIGLFGSIRLNVRGIHFREPAGLSHQFALYSTGV